MINPSNYDYLFGANKTSNVTVFNSLERCYVSKEPLFSSFL